MEKHWAIRKGGETSPFWGFYPLIKKMSNYILIVYIFLGNERAELKSTLLISYWKKSEIAAAFAPLDISIIACACVPPFRSQWRRWVFFKEPQPSEHCWNDLQVRHLPASILLRESQSSPLATESLTINPPSSLRPPPINPLLQCQLSTRQRSVEEKRVMQEGH